MSANPPTQDDGTGHDRRPLLLNIGGCRVDLAIASRLLDPPFALYRRPADATIAPGTRFYRVLLQLALAEWLAPRGGLLVHGCGLAAGGRGWLFIGPSGAGKSTVAELAGLPVLSDETCVVRLAPAGGVTLAGTPIGIGTTAGPVPLAEIFWLEQAPADELRPLDPGQALGRFMTQVVAAGRQDAELTSLLETAAAALDRIPMQTLRFTRSRRFVDMLELDAEA